MHRWTSVVAAIAAGTLVLGLQLRADAQGLATGLFDRYIDALRQEYRIPGLSVAIVQNGVPVLTRGFGQADTTQSIAASADTPYIVANLSETVGAALVLQQCVDYGVAELSDRMVRWTPFADPATTLGQVLGHVSASGVYQYNPERFGSLGGAVAECVKQPYAAVVGLLLDQLAMRRSVPGRSAVEPPDAALFPAATLTRYRSVLSQLAVPYRVGANGAPTRSDYPSATLTAATGLVSTVIDLAQFDAALDRGFVLSRELREASWQRGANRPTGLGWFVQSYGAGNERLVWHFGVAKDAYSSLILKVPGRQLTLIMLANSDALGTSLNTAQPDVTQSIFARTFLRLFVD